MTSIFEESYDVFEELGKGHFAVVKRCVHKSSGNQFAGKFIRKKRVCRGVPMEDIQREIDTLMQLNHSNVIRLHEVIDTGQTVILLLELVSGGELFDFVTEHQHLSESQTIHITRQILEAVQHMHSLHIAHLDLKPENILLMEKTSLPTIKVIDFGLSQKLDSVSEIKTVFGTPEFVAPEVVNFETLSLATDMWAIGVITYILLSGLSPFLGEDKQQTYTNVSTGSYTFEHKAFSEISSLAKDFIAKLLKKSPRERNTVVQCLKHHWIQPQVPDVIASPLSVFDAVQSGDVTAVEQVLHLDLNQIDKNGESVLHVAVRADNTEITRLLLSSGANLAAADSMGETAVFHAARHGNEQQLALLIRAGSSLTSCNKEGDTPLHIAATWGHLECVKLLVESSALVDVVNHQGATPLHLSLTHRHSDVATYLIHQAGADVELQDMNGETALHGAVREGLLGVVQSLCRLGCDTDIPNKQGLYPLHLAARYGHTEIIRSLCLAGCNTDVKNQDGAKAEITALKFGHNDISNLLNRVKNGETQEGFIRQLLPKVGLPPRVNIQLFGHSGVGKSTLVETLKTGYFSSFFRRSRPLVSNNTNSMPASPNKMHIEMDLTSRRNSLNFDLYNFQYTRGVDVQQVSLSGAGDVTLWDFSGQDMYFCVYHHLLTTSAKNAVFLVVFSLKDPPNTQLRQCHFWLTFLQARIPPTEPLGTNGISGNMPRVILVATHADTSQTLRDQSGHYVSEQANSVCVTLRQHYATTFHINRRVVVVDSHQALSPGIRLLKSLVQTERTSIAQGVPQMTGFCEAVRSWLPTLRKSAQSFPVVSWDSFVDAVRAQVNPLADSQHFSELLTQLQHMGEVVYLKSCLHPDLLVLSPQWLCGPVLGQLLSIDFVAHARITGCYTVEDFQSAFPQTDALALLQVLETLQLCIQCDVDGEPEYEFPCYNLVETLEGLWEEHDPRYKQAVYGGVRLHTPEGTMHLLHSVFPRIQVQLRRTVMNYCDSETDLYQWFHGSKLCSGLIESLVTLETSSHTSHSEWIEIKVRGPPHTAPVCFFFIEEILDIIDLVMVEMCPGLSVEKHVLSTLDLKNHCAASYCFPPDQLMTALLSEEKLDSKLYNPLAECNETLSDLIAFNSNEVREMLVPADQLSVNCLSTVCRQQLCALLDPPDPLGKDWCLLAVQLDLQDKIAAIEKSGNSPTGMLLDSSQASVGTLIRKLTELGREDASAVLLRNAPLYRINPELMQTQDTPSDSSQNLSR
ncbi:death-associated protein kinase 1-like [Macrosteles quadrilineatus]|uniref:death-associated protein kinase 1-like n=1 Tax=Macrosteles quadrilineatus TaxID=74068 RepID=UPI0023E28296|nr:death-associated protein kinase 1-like [Macrosteles quadrilineatus]